MISQNPSRRVKEMSMTRCTQYVAKGAFPVPTKKKKRKATSKETQIKKAQKHNEQYEHIQNYYLKT